MNPYVSPPNGVRFSGEHSSPLQYCLINFVGATCVSPVKTMLLSNRPGRKLLRPKHRTQSPGRRWEASRLPPVAGGRRRASGGGLEPERCRRQMRRGRRVCRGRLVTQLLAARKLPGTTNGRRGPRAFAPPVAEEAKAQCVQRSARSKPAPSGVASAGHRKRARHSCRGHSPVTPTGKHLRTDAEDEAFCLCPVRTQFFL